MATYKELIKRSLRQIRAIPKGDFEPSANELEDAFIALQHLFDEIASERWGVHTITQESLTLTANDGSYSIGSAGDLATARPKKILKAWIREANIDYQVEIVSREFFGNITDKTTTGRPYYLYYEESYPNGRVDLYPVPDSAYTLYIESWKDITKPTAVTDTVNLPSEYVPFFVDTLSVYIAPEYGTEASSTIVQRSALSRRRLKNIHSSNIPRATSDPFHTTSDYEIDGDYWR